MFTITVETRFEAPHQLRMPDGTAEPLHVHQWRVAVDISAEKLNSMGLVMDFRKVQKILDEVIQPLNGRNFDELDFFRDNNPSAENVARYLFERIEPALPAEVSLDFVKVRENPLCWAKFGRNNAAGML